MTHSLQSMIVLGLLWMPGLAAAQIAVSANDGKQARPGQDRSADSITVLDLGARPIRVLGNLHVPASMIGPPASVAVARNGRLALVTASQRLDPGGTLVPDDIVSVIDLHNPSAPRVMQTVHAGASASGVAINRAGTLALVTNAAADSVSVFRIARGQLTPAGVVALAPKSRPVDVGFARDGRSAFVVTQTDGKLIGLHIDGSAVRLSGKDVALGVQPFNLSVSQRANFALVTNLSGQEPSTAPGPKAGTLVLVDLAAGKLADVAVTGITPENVALSPGGRYAQVTVINGSNAPPGAANFNDHGYLQVYAIERGKLRRVAETSTGKWCQGGTWSRDEETIVLQCADSPKLEIYRFDGKTLTADPAANIPLEARPGAIAASFSR